MALNLNSLPKMLKNVEHTIEPLWADDTGRNTMSGKMSGTFIGWFDNLTVHIGTTTQSEMTSIRQSVEKSIIKDVIFFDTRTGTYKTEDFYGTAIKAIRKTNTTYEPFDFNLIAVEKRGDIE